MTFIEVFIQIDFYTACRHVSVDTRATIEMVENYVRYNSSKDIMLSVESPLVKSLAANFSVKMHCSALRWTVIHRTFELF